MLKTSDKRKLALKEKEWSKPSPLEIWFDKAWRKVKFNMKKFIEWYWFNGEKRKGDRALHLIEWWLVTLVALRVLRVI